VRFPEHRQVSTKPVNSKNRTVVASKRSMRVAKSHHRRFETQHAWCERAASTLQNAACMVQNRTIAASKFTTRVAKSHHRRFETHHA